MWDGAYPDVVCHLVRHTQSKDNVDGIKRGQKTPLSEKGRVQEMPAVTQRVQTMNVDCVLSSEADRAFLQLMDVVGTKKVHAKMNVPVFNEFRHPTWIINKERTAKVEAASHRRIAEFGPGYVPDEGEESFEETVGIIWDGLNYIRAKAREHRILTRVRGTKQFVVFSHGNRIRQIQSMIRAQGDLEKFAWLFRSEWEIGGYDNGAFSCIWYGNRFRTDQRSDRCWNIEGGDTSHLLLHDRSDK